MYNPNATDLCIILFAIIIFMYVNLNKRKENNIKNYDDNDIEIGMKMNQIEYKFNKIENKFNEFEKKIYYFERIIDCHIEQISKMQYSICVHSVNFEKLNVKN